MAGLTECSNFYPYGYNAPGTEAAIAKFAPPLAPNEYNKHRLPIPASARRHDAIPVAGNRWPSSRKQDYWNNINIRQSLPEVPRRFNIDALPSANRAVDPKDTPWSRSGALKVVASLTSGGAIEPPKDILAIARSFVSSSIDPARKDWWARRVNSLDQLEIISAPRGLNAEKMSLKEDCSNKSAMRPTTQTLSPSMDLRTLRQHDR